MISILMQHWSTSIAPFFSSRFLLFEINLKTNNAYEFNVPKRRLGYFQFFFVAWTIFVAWNELAHKHTSKWDEQFKGSNTEFRKKTDKNCYYELDGKIWNSYESHPNKKRANATAAVVAEAEKRRCQTEMLRIDCGEMEYSSGSPMLFFGFAGMQKNITCARATSIVLPQLSVTAHMRQADR